jgi:hypothetical protein
VPGFSLDRKKLQFGFQAHLEEAKQKREDQKAAKI